MKSGALEDPIHREDINVLQAASKYSSMVQLPNHLAAVGFGGLCIKTYIDHSWCYASEDKELVISMTHTHQDSGYDYVCNGLTLCWWRVASQHASAQLLDIDTWLSST